MYIRGRGVEQILGKRSWKVYLFLHLILKKKGRGGSTLMVQCKNPPLLCSTDISVHVPLVAIWYILYSFSVQFSKSPKSNSPLPCSYVEGTLPVALTCSPNLDCIIHTQINTASLSQKKIEQNQKPHVCIQKCMYSEKSTWRLFKLQKSVFSNQAHHTPHQTDILYMSGTA